MPDRSYVGKQTGQLSQAAIYVCMDLGAWKVLLKVALSPLAENHCINQPCHNSCSSRLAVS